MPALNPVVYNLEKWIEENKEYFLPPVCNKMMHEDGQMKVFCVGGPNQRKDYHIECGEELFYMIKGDMCLKVVEHGKHRDVVIKEGEIFLLPGKVAHSPQRQANTVGLVIERERDECELDGLRYFQESSGVLKMDSLFEEWFHCTDLGTQLGPVIQKFFNSEQFKTGKPLPGTIPENPPVILDSKVSLQNPFHLHSWIEENRQKLDTDGHIQIFGDNYQFNVTIYGKGENTDCCANAEIWIWQLEGKSKIIIEDNEYKLEKNDSILVRQGQRYTGVRPEGSVALICYQDPTRIKS
ncbi:3-hydroxyanthranilate 3,4-dioxygenase-like [Biomphalaria glabrata]|uniref:3-hydroxyanthranilate 3,4-dioxygenase n=1 Tax=Biomphalaria glabrata TaxID=6526 RepID=A0A9W2ZYF4_BIOGL|nr:3-hydroxyanthranilate 3,4-dioxygenase-like [Biomphalaria glabrata]